MLLAKINDITELKLNLKGQLKLEQSPRQLELIKEVQEKIKKLQEEINLILEMDYNSHGF